MLTLQMTSSMSRNTDTNIYNQALLAGSGIGQSLLEEIMGKAFDNKTLDGLPTVMVVDSLTPVGSLGPETGEVTYGQFDDIDDYNNYQRTDSLAIFGKFYSKAKIQYIYNLLPDSISSVRTFAKRVDVKVWNNYLKRDNGQLDTIRFTSIKAY